MELLDEFESLIDRIPMDFGGGSWLPKVYLMGHLAATRGPETFVEIGVYRGRSFLPVATAMRRHGGKAFGIDPYSKEHAHEHDIAAEFAPALQEWIAETDFDGIYREVTALISELGLESTAEVLRTTSEQAATGFRERGVPIGMLHIDGNHDTRFVMRDVELYLPLVAPGGVVVMDDINWNSVKPAYERVKERMTVLFEAPTYSFLINRPDGADLEPLKQGLALMHEAIVLRSQNRRPLARHGAAPGTRPPDRPKVSVSLTTYNQERYIATAIEGAVVQKTNFPFEVVIADDCSTDRTGAICREYQQQYPGLIRLVHREKNLGAVPNYLETFQCCRGEYVAFLEGDDYWTDPDKLQKQVEFLDSHKDFSICCHNVTAVDADGVARGALLRNVPEVSTVDDLCRGDYIATASCMVRNGLLAEIPAWLYALPGCDWALDILHAEKGKIGFLPATMAAYRIHPEGIWSGCPPMDKLRKALDCAQTINRQLEYRHARAFQVYEQSVRNEIRNHESPGVSQAAPSVVGDSHEMLVREYETALYELEKARSLNQAGKRELRAAKRSLKELKKKYQQARRIIDSAEAWQRRSWITRALHRWRPGARIAPPKSPAPGAADPAEKKQLMPAPAPLPAVPPAAPEPTVDLVVLDDIFPHPLSAFRFEEYTRYLEAIPNMRVYSTGAAFGCLRDTRTLEEIIAEADARHPLLRGRVSRFEPGRPLRARLGYVVFLGNVAYFLDRLEKDKIPFVFTLYPGGSFELNDPAKDRMMRRVFSSPWFRRVIVTQNITRDYLLEHDFCAPGQIVYVQGGVTPSEHLHRDLSGRRDHGFGKARLDICFVAHRYSKDGADKGYDVFIEVARKLAARHDNIFFHVVGGFDETILDVSDLGSRIAFYGSQEPSWFETFYLDKDIILSPNIPFRLAPGAFDGFPTGCCTDAALHAVAMFCTDLLGLNENFTDREDIVLIPYNADAIARTIEHYHQNPAELRELARKGRETARHLCSFDYQMVPRLRLLQELIQEASHA